MRPEDNRTRIEFDMGPLNHIVDVLEMKLTSAIALVLAVPFAALAAIPDLTEEQQERIQAARDNSGRPDDPAMYALLENAKEWTGGEQGVSVADYGAMLQSPEEHRGELYLIEGELQMVVPVDGLSRSGWEKVSQWVIKTYDRAGTTEVSGDNSKTDSGRRATTELNNRSATPGPVVIVYLLNPPKTTPYRTTPTIPLEQGSEVRLPARFYRLRDVENQDNRKTTYLTFVGNHVTQFEDREPEPSMPRSLVVAVCLCVLGMYWIIRYYTKNRKTKVRAMSELLEKRRRERQAFDDEHPIEEVDLPDDPAAALATLDRVHGGGKPDESKES